jgi:DNA polymerase/3'-5' exonuclease PolX
VDPLDAVRERLRGVWGAGFGTVETWIAANVRSIEDLDWRRNPAIASMLTPNQKVGIQYYDELQSKIPRDEVRQLEKTVAKVLLDIDENFWHTVCGSYRRGAELCGDIDMLITHRLDFPTSEKLTELIRRLHQQEFLTDDLAWNPHSKSEKRPEEEDRNGKYMGVCRLPGVDPVTGEPFKHRRIDIRLYPLCDYPTALLTFTGNTQFNRTVARWSEHLGLKLSEHGLRRQVDGTTSVERFPVRSEQDIFKYLGLYYLEPHERHL